MNKRNFTQKEKIAVLKGAKKATVRYAAKVAGIHYTTVYDWRRQFAAWISWLLYFLWSNRT